MEVIPTDTNPDSGTGSRPATVRQYDLSIIFVNWNSVPYLADSIASIYEHTRGLELEIIVVDNASPNDNVDTLKTLFNDVRIVKSPDNLGFARANNLGFRMSRGAYVLLLNPDTKLVGPAINTMMERMQSLPDAGIIGCQQVDPDLTVQTTSIQRFPRILNQIFGIEYVRRRWPGVGLWNLTPLFSASQTPTIVEVIPGACMLLKREVFARVGMFTEDYFMYGEDIDLNQKVARQGLRNYYIPDATIIHYGGRSSAQQTVSQWATIMKCRAMGQYYVRNHGRLYALLYRGAMGICAAGRLAALGLMMPFQKVLQGKISVRPAAVKWTVILRWAVGMDCGFIKARN